MADTINQPQQNDLVIYKSTDNNTTKDILANKENELYLGINWFGVFGGHDDIDLYPVSPPQKIHSSDREHIIRKLRKNRGLLTKFHLYPCIHGSRSVWQYLSNSFILDCKLPRQLFTICMYKERTHSHREYMSPPSAVFATPTLLIIRFIQYKSFVFRAICYVSWSDKYIDRKVSRERIKTS